MKQIQIIIPDSVLDDVDEVLKDKQVGGITHYRVERRGITKADACCWESTMK
jgi:nitrogen regulatory protein PII